MCIAVFNAPVDEIELYLNVSRVCGAGIVILSAAALASACGVAMKRRCNDVMDPAELFSELSIQSPARGASERVKTPNGFKDVKIMHESGI